MTIARHWRDAHHATTRASLYADRVVEAVWSERWRDACDERLACEAALIGSLICFLCGCRADADHAEHWRRVALTEPM